MNVLIRTCCSLPLILIACQTETSHLGDDPGAPGGASLVYRGDSMLSRSVFGLAEVESNRPVTDETCFRLASVSKQFTAMSILILKSRERLRLSQTLADFFPGFAPVGERITVHHLLTHTSGLVAYEDVMPDTTTVPILDPDVLNLVQPIDSTYFPPGTRYRYSNTGYALLALIVERVSGMPYAEFLRTEIFRPLGMDRSVAIEHGKTDAAVRAFGYSRSDSGMPAFLRTDQSTTSHVLGDGGIYSCVDDLLKWHLSLLDRPLIPRALLDSAFTEHAKSDDGEVRYGYGWMLGEFQGMETQFHSGSTIGFRTFLLRIPEKRLFVVVLMNRNDGPAERIARELAAAALKE